MWPGQKNTASERRKPKKTAKFLAVFGFSRYSHLRVFLIASLIDCRFCCLMQKQLSCFRHFWVCVFSPFSGFRCSRRFRVHKLIPPVFGFSPFSYSEVDSSRMHIFVLSHVQSCHFCATAWIVSKYILHMPKAVKTLVFSATQWTASALFLHMPKAVTSSCSKCHRQFCFHTYFIHAQNCNIAYSKC